jgi:hypothetical protein
MNLSIIRIVIVVLLGLVQACTTRTSEVVKTEVQEDVWEEDYPWKHGTTKAAIEAIERSINNLKIPREERDDNFPADPGPFGVPFSQFEIEEFVVIGYSFSESTPDIYEIEFRPQGIECCANRITVEINIRTNMVLKVYMGL